MMKKCRHDCEAGEDMLLLKAAPLESLLCSLLFLTGFGAGGAYLIINNRTIGWVFLLLCPFFLILTFFEWHNSFLLLTKESITECDLFKKERVLRWDRCQYVGFHSSGILTDLICTSHIPEKISENKISLDYKWPKKLTIRIPWSLLSSKQKKAIGEIVKTCQLREDIKKHLETIQW